MDLLRKYSFMVTFCLSGVVLLSGQAFTQDVKIVHLNVGQGDATLILGPQDNTGNRVSILVDAGDIPQSGDKDGGDIVANVLHRNGVRRLNWLIATHYHADHIGGVVAGTQGMHGDSFILGLNGVPGATGDDDGNGTIDWMDPQTMRNPDPQELTQDDDVEVLNFVDRGNVQTSNTQTYQKYVGMINAMIAALGPTNARRISLNDQQGVNNFEINLGEDRVRAMRHMAERTGVDELASLAAILIQTERFGTSIADTLRSFAASMREERSFTAEESAEKMPVKLIIPMCLFIFPAVFITLGGPAFIRIYTVLLGE